MFTLLVIIAISIFELDIYREIGTFISELLVISN